jgi:hypothetical protein
MPRTTRRKGNKGFRLAKRLLSPVEQLLGLAKDVGTSGFRRTGNIFRSGMGFAGNTVSATGRRINGAVNGLILGKSVKSRRSERKSRRQSRKSRRQSRQRR